MSLSHTPADPRVPEEMRKAAAEITSLRERLELSPDHPYDGIYCRDETIRAQDAQITRLREELERKDAAMEKADALMPTVYELTKDAEITALKAEVEWLRNFVLFVDKWTNYKPNKPEKPTSYENCVKTIAPMAAEFRAALTQEKTDVD